MGVHFEELTGVPLKESFLNNVEKKGDRLLNFMRTVCADKSKKFLRRVTNLQVLRGQKEGCSEDLKDMLLLLLSYFNEKEENLFHYVEETCLPKEVRVESLPVTPCIIVCGKTILSFMVKNKAKYDMECTVLFLRPLFDANGWCAVKYFLLVSSLQETPAMPQSSSC